MCYILSEHFTGIFLFLCMIRYDPLRSGISAYAAALNSSEEIKNIFSLPDVTESVVKGVFGSGNFAEGGLINLNATHSTSRTSINNVTKNYFSPKNVSHDKSLPKKQNTSSFLITTPGNGNLSSTEISTVKTLLPTKLTETGSNLFLGAPEVIHINGTSSIKPRKGVHFNKIVPRKGVDTENESNHGYLENEACFQLTETECYNVTGIHGLECSCCLEGNTLGKVVKQQVLVNCKNCKPINILSSEKESCKNICCNSVVHDIYSGSMSHDISNNYLHYETVTNSQNVQEKVANVSEKVKPVDNLSKKMVTETKDVFVSLKKNSKLKPSMTKVPYDVEVVTELLSRTQQKVFVPIIVSIFLLPLIGILLFFLWRRTKEYWDKRYYKRMDFLIDGIYND